MSPVTRPRTLVIGDVHGCLDELDELLRVADVRPGRERLIFLGDLVDRGPNPVGVVRRVRELGAECLLGNHEEKHLRWVAHEAKRAANPAYRNPMRPLLEPALSQHRALGADDIAFLRSLPLQLAVDGWLLVHAGYATNRPRVELKPATLLRVRYVDEQGAMVSMNTDDPGRVPPGAVPWATHWTGPESVLYGHAVHGMEGPRVDEPVPGVRCIGLDTGCCFGGRLTAYDLEGGAFVQVNAKRAYAALKGAVEE